MRAPFALPQQLALKEPDPVTDHPVMDDFSITRNGPATKRKSTLAGPTDPHRIAITPMSNDSSRNRPLPDSERGKRIWRTRRANRLLRAVAKLRDKPITEQIHSSDAAHDISDHLALKLPLSVTALPRAYELRPNRIGQRALWQTTQGTEVDAEFTEVLGASFADDLPSLRALAQFATDLRTGWLEEVSLAVQKDLEWLIYGE